MDIEKRQFIRWNLNVVNLPCTVLFLLQKIIFKILKSTSQSTQVFYPSSVKKALKNFEVGSFSSNWSSANPVLIPNDLYKKNDFEITLASMQLKVSLDQDLNWEETFSDNEDNESYHRWNWLLNTITNEEVHLDKFSNWSLKQIRNWNLKFINEVDENIAYRKARWQSYSVGERLANISLYSELVGLVLEKEDVESFRRMASFLSKNLEYFSTQTGNHVFNNARGLYLFALKSNDKSLEELSEIIIRRELPLLISSTGFLREGSSHYQFLFTRWIQEIMFFCKRYERESLANFLLPFKESAQRACSIFKIGSEGEYPLIGDISPDFTPSWLSNSHLLDFTMVKQEVVKNEGKWENLFGLSFLDEPSIEETFTDDEWFRFKKGNFKVLGRLPAATSPQNVGHFHQDILSFVLNYKENRILIDSGRKSYETSDSVANVGVSVAGHNGIKIGETTPYPNDYLKYPPRYLARKSEHSILSDGIKLTTEGFSRIEKGLLVERNIKLNEESVKITDQFRIKNGKNTSFTSYFHIDHLFKVEENGENEIIFSKDDVKFSFKQLNKKNKMILLPERSPEKYQFFQYGKGELGSCIQVQGNISENVNEYLIEMGH